MIIYYGNYIKYFFVYFLILFSILSVSTQLKSQTSEIKDCNGNNITTQIIVTSSNNQSLILTNCTFSNGSLSAYLNCIRTNNPSLPATASLIVELSADPASGISAIDFELLKQEVLQKNIISNTCNRVGCDSDVNNKLNTIDLCLIRRHIAGISNINPSWKFYKSQNLSLTGIGDTTDLIFPITDFPLSTINVIAVHNGNVNQVTTPNDTCVLLCKPDLRITPGQDEVRKPTPEYFLLNKSCSFPNLSLQILNASGQVIGNEITQNMVGNQLTAKLQIGNTTQICTTKLSVYPCEVYVNIDVDQTNTTDSSFVDVSVRNAEFISGYQLSLKFDTTHLQFVRIEKGNEPGFNANNDAHYNGRGHVNISRFNESSNLGLEEGTRLFRIKFKRKSSTTTNVIVDTENVESLFFDINKAEYCTNITYLLDTNPPVCLQDTIMLQGDNAVGYATLKFTDYASDDFGTVLFVGGYDEFDFPITNLDTFNCGANIFTYVTFRDANGQSKQCIFRVIVDCDSTGGGDTLMCNIEEPVLLNNGSNNFIVKMQEFNGQIYLLSNEQRNGINNILFTKINKSTGETWSYTSSQNVSASDFYIKDNGIYIVGYTLPFDNGNNSKLIKLQDNTNSLDLVYNRTYDVDSSREGFRGITQSNSQGFLIMGHRGFGSLDDNFILRVNDSGNIIQHKRYNFDDDQMWSGLIQDLDNKYIYFGEEANRVEGVIIQFNDSLDLTNSFLYTTTTNIKDVAVDFTALQRVILTDSKIILVNKDFLPLDVIVLNGINANYNITGPIQNGNDTHYYVVSRRVVANKWFTTITKIQVRNNLMEINWTKKVEGGDANNQIGHLDLFGNDNFLYVESRIDTINGSGNYDIMILKYPQDSCKFENLNLSLNRFTVNPVQQSLIVTDRTIPNFINGENGITNKFSCINYLPCKKDSCQSSFTFSTNCNRITLSGIAQDFNNPSSLTYNWSSTNTNFTSTAKDTVFNYFGDLPEVIICLEASDGVCSATFCDTIPVTLPMPPVFPGCPESISLSSVDSCSWTFPLNIPLATDPCTGMPAMVGCLRSDGLPLSASFPLGVTTITCTAFSVLGNEFNATCEFDLEISDETKPICIPKNAEIYLDNLGFTTFSPQLIDGGSSDNCGEITLSIEGQQTFTCSDVGNQIKTLIVSDESNNTSTCQAIIIVRDTIRPICNGKTLNKIINGNGNASFADIDLNNNSSDNCGNLTFSASKTMFNCADVRKTNIITLTVTDQSGNSSSCPVEVKLTDPNDYCGCLSDVTAPVCKSKNITLNLDASGNVNLTQEMINDGSFDFCSDVSLIVEEPLSFDCKSIGNQIVNLIVKDQANNMSSCSADVIIQDKLKPVCSITPNFYLDVNGQVVINKDHPNITLNDNCDTVNIISNPPIYNCNSIGSRFFSLTVSDVSGNTNFCVQNITIRDTLRPTCTIPPKTFYLQGNGQVLVTQNQLNIVSKDNCLGVTTFFSNINYNCNDIGMKPVSASVQDASGNMNTCSTLITIRDTIRPVCRSKTINKIIDENGSVSILATELNNNSTDNCSNVTFTASKTIFNCSDVPNANFVTFIVTDQSGNSSSCPAEVIITDPTNFCACINDVTGPVCKTKNITLDLDTTGNVLLTPQLIDDNSFDACSDITLQIEGPQSFDCNSVGSQIVNLVVTDQANNVSFCTAYVTVQDKQLPNCLITPAQFHLDQSGNVALNIDNLVINSSDNCSGVTATFDSINYSCDDIGENTIIVTVTDVSGNTNSCSTVITISDTIKPICNIETITYYLDVNGQVSLTQPQLNITANDNCTGLTTTFNTVNYTCNDIGTKDISATVRDVAGNTNTCSAQISIRDTIRPVCKTKILNKSIGDNGSVTILATELNDNSTDNCSNITFSASKTIFSCEDVGNTNIVTLMVTDQSGNSSSCPVEVKLTDTNNYCACLNDVTAPVCKTKNITVNLDATGNVSITPAMINDGSFDACTDVTLQIEGPQSFDCSSIGNQPVTLVVTDLANNVSFCPTTITIVDEIAPDCILVPSTYYLDQQGLLSLSTEKLNISTNDNCSNVLVEFNTLVFTCSNIGSSLITARVTDESGNTNVCSTIIMTRDTIRPFCSLPSRTYFLDESGSILIDKNKLGLVNSDNCGTLNTNFTNVIYNCNDLGQKLVSIIVFDASGNTSMCSSFITIKDTIAPKCSIPTNTYFLDTNGQASLTQTQLNITANDNCVGVTTTFNTVNYTCNDIGVKTISATVRDVAGNTNACTAQITINDTIRPICFIRDTIVTSTDGVGAMVNFNGRAIDNCAEGLTLSYSQPSGQFYPCGEYNITMTARDNSGNISTCPFKLTVKDCDDCCLSEQAFMDATSVELDLTSDLISPDDCMVQFISPKLSLCQIVTEISWGDGTVSRGSFTNAVDFTHQYTEPAIYEVCVTYEEESTQRCFENKICNTFEVLDNCTLKRSDATFDYNKIIIFPNPTTGSFNVSGGSIFTHYEMMDQLGRAVIAKRHLEKENDISQLQNGLYFTRLHVGSIIISKTIIKIQ